MIGYAIPIKKLKSNEMKQPDLESPTRWWHNDSYETQTQCDFNIITLLVIPQYQLRGELRAKPFYPSFSQEIKLMSHEVISNPVKSVGSKGGQIT